MTTDPQATGALSKLLLGFETEFGVLAEEGVELPFVSFGLKRTKNKVSSPVITGDFNPPKPSDGKISVVGPIRVPMDSVASWYWFKAACNTLTTTGTGPFNHEFKMIGATQRTSISLEIQHPDLKLKKYFQYTGCKINGISFSVGEEGEKFMDLDVVAQDRTIAASSFDDAAPQVKRSPLDDSMAQVKVGGDVFATSTTTSCNVAFNMDTDTRFIGGGGKVGTLSDAMIKVSGKHDFIFTNTLLLQMAIDSTETSIEQIFIAASDKKVAIKVPELMFQEEDPGVPGPQGIVISLPWEGYYDDSPDASAIVVTVTNGDAHA